MPNSKSSEEHEKSLVPGRALETGESPTPWLSLFLALLFGLSAHFWRTTAMAVSMVFLGLLVGPFLVGCIVGGIIKGISPTRPLSGWAMFIVGLICGDALFYVWFGQWPLSGVIAVLGARDHQALYLGTLVFPVIQAIRLARTKGAAASSNP